MIDYYSLSGLDIRLTFEAYQRYAFAQIFCNGKNVIDAGSKFGVGSYILSKVASKVIGIDIDEQRIATAINNVDYKPCFNLGFVKYNLESDLKKVFKTEIDVIICMETLEHLENPNKFIEQVPGLLRKGGMFIASVPNGDRKIKEHLHIFDRLDDFAQLVDSKFSEKMYFVQNPYSFIFIGRKK